MEHRYLLQQLILKLKEQLNNKQIKKLNNKLIEKLNNKLIEKPKNRDYKENFENKFKDKELIDNKQSLNKGQQDNRNNINKIC